MKLLLKILLGVLTLAPILSLLVMLVEATISGFHFPYRISNYLESIIFWLTPTLVLIYLVILARTDKLKTDTKLLWAVLFLIGHVITMPVYYFVNIWKEKTVAKEITD